MQPLRYFAYGSNLLFARLHARCPSIENLGIARLEGYRLSFNKPGGDGSGKCGIIESVSGDHVLGVLYAISPDDKTALDVIEGVGHGYEAMGVATTTGAEPGGERVSCFTYVPTRADDSLLPFDWYRDFVLFGARENHFPARYVEVIESIRVRTDPDAERSQLNQAILQAGFASQGSV